MTISYCKCGHPYQKNTTIWTHVEYKWRPRCKFDCDAVKDGRHTNWAQNAGKKDACGFTRLELYTIPDALCKDIVCASFGSTFQMEEGSVSTDLAPQNPQSGCKQKTAILLAFDQVTFGRKECSVSTDLAPHNSQPKMLTKNCYFVSSPPVDVWKKRKLCIDRPRAPRIPNQKC